MPEITINEFFHAPVERVFDLARSIDAHVASQSRHEERAVSGCTSGLISLGQTVTWEARHFGVRQRLTSKITAMDRPNHFRDTLVAGAFTSFEHDHFFTALSDGRVEVRDVFRFTSPLGVLGRFANRAFLTRYMTRLLEERNEVLKILCESADGWQAFLPSES